MRWPMSRRGDDPTGTDSVKEIPAEPVQTETVEDETKTADASTEVDESDHDDQSTSARRRIRWSRAIAFGVLPGLARLLADAAGFLKWQGAPVPAGPGGPAGARR